MYDFSKLAGKRVNMNDRRIYINVPEFLIRRPSFRDKMTKIDVYVYSILHGELKFAQEYKWFNDNEELYVKYPPSKFQSQWNIDRAMLGKALETLKELELLEIEESEDGELLFFVCEPDNELRGVAVNG